MVDILVSPGADTGLVDQCLTHGVAAVPADHHRVGGVYHREAGGGFRLRHLHAQTRQRSRRHLHQHLAQDYG